jgi:chorismate mutase
VNDAITALRAELESVDDALIDLLAHRADIVRQIWAIKATTGVPIKDPDREQAVISRLIDRAHAAGLDEDAVRPILFAIVGRPLLARAMGGE